MIIPNVAASWSRIFYGWRMIGLVSAIRVVGSGLHQYGFTIFFLPISQDLGLEPSRNLACLLPLLGDALRWQLGLFTSFYTLLDASFPIVWAQWEISTDGSTLRRFAAC
jgi:hypothetical protein